MAKNFVQNGDVITLVAPSGGVVSGGLYIIGDIAAVATYTAAEDEEFEGATTGVYTFPKTSADTPAQGANAYFDGDEVTTEATGNRLVGVFTAAFANGDTFATVRLNGGSLPAAGETA